MVVFNEVGVVKQTKFARLFEEPFINNYRDLREGEQKISWLLL